MRTFLPFTLVLAFPLALPAQEIPNGGFEEWTNTGNYLDPTGWLTSNMVSWSINGTLTCEQGTPGPVGAYFVKVTDRLLNGGMQQASISIGEWGVFPGFPFSERPEAFTGLWQYHPQGVGHDGVVSAALTRWNPVAHQREVIANAPIHTLGPIDDWQAFSVPFLYYSDLDPDTAMVSISASQNTSDDGTSIWVDDLGFGQTQSVQELVPALVQLWPSPASDQLRIRAGAQLSEVVVQDLSGRVMSRMALDREEAVVPVASIPAGMYLAELRLADGRKAVRSFVKE